MNKTFVARAPGKLFLLGEYAVLDGAPSVVAAIDRHVEVRLRLRRSRGVTRIAAPGHCAQLELPASRLDAAPAELRFARVAIETAARELPQLGGVAFDIEIRSALEHGAGSGEKLGLGGSAAVTTAIVAALYAAGGRDPATCRDDLFATAFNSHRGAQSGVGSGADIAASVYGGVLLFEPQPESLPRVRALRLPPDTRLLVAWSGKSAATEPLVRRYLALPVALAHFGTGAQSHAAAPVTRSDFLRASRASVGRFVGRLETGWLSTRSVNSNGEALERLACAAGLPLLTPELRRILSLARAAGAGAKLSGAGGGDCAIALTDAADVAERVRSTWRTASFAIPELRLEPGGVSVAQD